MLGEREVRLSARAGGRDRAMRTTDQTDSGTLSLADDLSRVFRDKLSAGEQRARGFDPMVVASIRRSSDQLDKTLPNGNKRGDPEETLAQALLFAFSDRVAKRRRPEGRELVLSGGGSATVAEESGVTRAVFVVVVRADETPRGVLAREVSSIEPEWLLELFPERITDRIKVLWGQDRVVATSELCFDELVVDTGPAPDNEDTQRRVAELLAKRALDKPWTLDC